MNANRHKQSIIAKAQELGFFYCGFSEAGFLEDEVPRLENWLKNNRHGKMSYMENHFDKRLDPTKLVPGAKSVISLLFNYATMPQKSLNMHLERITIILSKRDFLNCLIF
jgi:epoxyqueuosine reductase